jgi:hypothetical protein
MSIYIHFTKLKYFIFRTEGVLPTGLNDLLALAHGLRYCLNRLRLPLWDTAPLLSSSTSPLDASLA